MNASGGPDHLFDAVQVALLREASIIAAACQSCHVASPVVVSGMGAARARSTLQSLVARGARSVIGIGFAGALRDPLAVGDLIVPGAVCDQRGVSVSLDTSLHRYLIDALRNDFVVHDVPLLSTDTIVHDVAGKAALARISSAAAVDMESAAMARTAQEEGIAFAVMRVVSDGPRQCISRSVAQSVDALGRVLAARMFFTIVLRPWEIPDLVRLGLSSARASRTLEKAWSTVLERANERATLPC